MTARSVFIEGYLSRNCSINIGLYYDIPVLFIQRTDSEHFVYLALKDWEIMRRSLPMFETFMKVNECPLRDYSENLVFSFNVIAYMENGKIRFLNTTLNDGEITLSRSELLQIKRLELYLDKHLRNLTDVNEVLYLGTRSWRRRALEMCKVKNNKRMIS